MDNYTENMINDTVSEISEAIGNQYLTLHQRQQIRKVLKKNFVSLGASALHSAEIQSELMEAIISPND